MFGKRGNNREDGPKGARNVDQSKVFFECNKCSFGFQEDPNQDFIECPQCGSDDTMRV